MIDIDGESRRAMTSTSYSPTPTRDVSKACASGSCAGCMNAVSILSIVRAARLIATLLGMVTHVMRTPPHSSVFQSDVLLKTCPDFTVIIHSALRIGTLSKKH